MREVSCQLDVVVHRSADLVLTVAPHTAYEVSERLDVRLDGQPVDVIERVDTFGTRRHCFQAGLGRLTVAYAATVTAHRTAGPQPGDDLTYLRPSRYCDSDRLVNVAQSLFAESAPARDTVGAIRRWTLESIQYAPGTTDHLDGATEVFLSRRGVCRDTAHLLTAFARAMGIPARVAAVYAPGLVPMDFHAVSEVLIDGIWWIVDGTGLAPRGSMVRIAAGRDAADIAFLDAIRGQIELVSMTVDARADVLPHDDGVLAVAFS
ncbi:putative transglutaminase-like protein [Nocardioides baekrokdamisoli]|uniref:Putative transglutaminase-like protein n=1 Tax=Nocardioides baekrokdamisoli TaxID=1804624 RepID=A0A3G9IK55_9ACTN|nr:transglutaminase family protein [Nocardioides baekrokdamisoli]BBH18552.1 putative transglutaminase-like protein [Nocardioides baekrokdamisoli]